MTDDDEPIRDESTGRFRPGRTGNSKGRPRRSADLGAELRRAFAEKAPVTEGGERKKLSRTRITAKQLANQSSKGDLRAVKLSKEILKEEAAKAAGDQGGPQALSETDQVIFERWLARARAAGEAQ